jgi:hypothetical protein
MLLRLWLLFFCFVRFRSYFDMLLLQNNQVLYVNDLFILRARGRAGGRAGGCVPPTHSPMAIMNKSSNVCLQKNVSESKRAVSTLVMLKVNFWYSIQQESNRNDPHPCSMSCPKPLATKPSTKTRTQHFQSPSVDRHGARSAPRKSMATQSTCWRESFVHASFQRS